MSDNRKKGRGLTVDRRNVVVSLALMERHINYTQKSTVNTIEIAEPSDKTDLETVYYRSSTTEQEKGD